jgi:NAD(P)-dependent dehydrogenase (short-subunit alcohol dehydrogenase family)
MSNTVLVTGSSTGIGRACVEKFQAEGWNVAATMRTPGKETSLQKLDRVAVLPLDVTNDASVRAAVKATLDKFGAIDAVINNAGYGAVGPVEFCTDAQIERQYSTNVAGPLRVMRAVLPHMRARRAGVIVNITSIGGRVGFPLNSLYCGTKFALEGITEAMQYEVAAFGVRVKLVEPGGVSTEFVNNLDMMVSADTDAYNAFIQKVTAGFAKGRENYSTPAKIAGVIFDATLDPSRRLRYPAGDDAVALMAARSQAPDELIFKTVQSRFD